jgi:hypothetical protein
MLFNRTNSVQKVFIIIVFFVCIIAIFEWVSRERVDDIHEAFGEKDDIDDEALTKDEEKVDVLILRRVGCPGGIIGMIKALGVMMMKVVVVDFDRVNVNNTSVG